MSQNGDDAEVRDAIINPVQRRESSASRFLKHFRPDRSNPAYHSEGKGLRKRRNWNSERQLTNSETSDNPAGSAVPDPQQPLQQRQSQNQPQRSHSFSEPDGPALIRTSASKENNTSSNGVRESFRWRFSNSSKSSKSSDQPPKGGDTVSSKKPVLSRAKSEGLSSSGGGNNCDAETAPPPPAPAANWSQSSNNLSNNKSPSKKSFHDSSTTVVDGRPPVVQLQQLQPTQAKQQDQGSGGLISNSSANNHFEPIYSNGKSASGRVYFATSAAEADYVNYEMFASSHHWAQQKQLEPDLIRNLPYQQQQQQQNSSALQNGQQQQVSPKHRQANLAYMSGGASLRRHGNRIVPGSANSSR